MTLTKEQVQPILNLINTYNADIYVGDTSLEYGVEMDDALYAAITPIIKNESWFKHVQVGQPLNMMEVFDCPSVNPTFHIENPESYKVLYNYLEGTFILLTHENTMIVSDKHVDMYIFKAEKRQKYIRYRNNIHDEWLYELDYVTDTFVDKMKQALNKQ